METRTVGFLLKYWFFYKDNFTCLMKGILTVAERRSLRMTSYELNSSL